LKIVEWTDARGYKHRAAIRDGDTLADAQNGRGIPLDPPDVASIDWEAVRRDLHNHLLQLGITNFEVVRSGRSQLNSALIRTLKTHVMELLRRK